MENQSELSAEAVLHLISGQVTAGGVTFNYTELKFGTNRGIKIWREGVPGDVHEYKFDPNPHDDPWYNKHQEEFYAAAATAIADLFIQNDAYPAFGTQITVHKIDYTLQER